MIIINRTRNTVLGKEVLVADRFFPRMIGLLARRNFHQGQALILRPCNCIHTLFMRFPIDCLFVDKNYRVIKAISDIRPFRVTRVYRLSKFVVELPQGTVKLTSTQDNDILALLPKEC
jgi:uncharacterized membrane protein (UPF0127 family)